MLVIFYDDEKLACYNNFNYALIREVNLISKPDPVFCSNMLHATNANRE